MHSSSAVWCAQHALPSCSRCGNHKHRCRRKRRDKNITSRCATRILDKRDDLGACLSNPDGTNLVRITPIPSRALDKTYGTKRNALTLRIVQDTNNDKMLDDQDAPSLIEVNVANRKMVREVLNATTLVDLMRQAEPRRRENPAGAGR